MWVPPPGAPLSSVLSWLRSGLPIPAALLETVQAPAGSAPQRATLYRMATGDQAWQPLQGGAQRNPTKYGEWQTGAREGAGSDAGSAPLSHRKRPPPQAAPQSEARGGGKPPCTLAASGPWSLSAVQPALDSANKPERLRLCWARAEPHHPFSAQMGRGLAEDAGRPCSYVCVRARAGGTRLSAPPCLRPLR